MKRFRIIFFSVFFLYHLSVLIMVFFINKNAEDIGFLLQLHDKISLLFYGAFIGLILYFAMVGLFYLQQMRFDKIMANKNKNINELKAKLYDKLTEEPSESPSSESENVEEEDRKEE